MAFRAATRSFEACVELLGGLLVVCLSGVVAAQINFARGACFWMVLRNPGNALRYVASLCCQPCMPLLKWITSNRVLSSTSAICWLSIGSVR